MGEVRVYSTRVSSSLFGFRKTRHADGSVWSIHAHRVSPRVGLIEVTAYVISDECRRMQARFLAGGRLREVWVEAWFCTERNSVFARRFNAAVMPEVERVWRAVTR